MKKIDKQASPQWFEEWKRNFKREYHREPHYNNDFSSDYEESGNRRRRLRKSLVEEQGEICCYCMRRISIDNSHIEHFLPKDRFTDLDLSYDNLLASCNGEKTLLLEDEHCGHRKNHWWREDMVSPTNAEIEKLFRYQKNGKIRAVKDREVSNIAQEMIRNLGLDSFYLERERRGAIEASEVFDVEDYSDDEIRDLIEFYSNKDQGVYVPYCKAIVDCLEEML